MAVLIEASCVVIRRSSILGHFAGGWEAFTKSLPNRMFAFDDHLACVGFMATIDSDYYATALVGHRVPKADIAIVQQIRGVQTDSTWLRFANLEMHGMKVSLCWLNGTTPDTMCAPGHWKYEGSLSQKPSFVSAAEVGDRMKFIRHENGVDVYLDLQTNKEHYVGRPVIAGDSAGAVHTQVVAMLKDAMKIGEQGPVPKPRLVGRRDPRYTRLNRDLLPAIQRIVAGPGQQMMPAHFTHGVILRLLGRSAEAEQALRAAHALKPDSPDVLRDLVRLLLEQKRPSDALPLAKKAAELDPSDASLVGNLASCLMRLGKWDDALAAVDQALEIDPAEKINQNIRNYILEKRPIR